MELYVVQNRDGQFLRPRGMNGGGQWVGMLSLAKFYPRLGPAKAQVTFWSSEKYGTPKLLKFTLKIEEAEEIDMAEYVRKTKEKKIAATTKRKLKELERKSREIDAQIAKLNKD